MHAPNIIYLLFSLFSFVNLIQDFSVICIFRDSNFNLLAIFCLKYFQKYFSIVHDIVKIEILTVKWDAINIFSDNF